MSQNESQEVVKSADKGKSMFEKEQVEVEEEGEEEPYDYFTHYAEEVNEKGDEKEEEE